MSIVFGLVDGIMNCFGVLKDMVGNLGSLMFGWFKEKFGM